MPARSPRSAGSASPVDGPAVRRHPLPGAGPRGGRALPGRSRPRGPPHHPARRAGRPGRSRSASTGCAARVRAVEQDGDGVTAAGLRARWLVAADGLHSPVRRSLGLQVAPAPGRPARYGLRRHYLVAPVVAARRGPLGRARRGLRHPGRRRTWSAWPCWRPGGTSYDEALAGFPALLARLRGAEPATAVRGAGPLRQVGPVAGVRAGAARRRRRRVRGRPDRRGRGGRAGHGRRGGGGGRRRPPAGLPGGLAAGDPALPVVGDRPAGGDGPARPCAAAWSRWPRPPLPSSAGPSTRSPEPGDDGSVGNYRATVGVS